MALEISSDVVFLQKRLETSEDFIIVNSFSVDNLVVAGDEQIVGVVGIFELFFDPIPSPCCDFFIFVGSKYFNNFFA